MRFIIDNDFFIADLSYLPIDWLIHTIALLTLCSHASLFLLINHPLLDDLLGLPFSFRPFFRIYFAPYPLNNVNKDYAYAYNAAYSESNDNLFYRIFAIFFNS